MYDVDLIELLHLGQVQGQRIHGGLELGVAAGCDLRGRLVAAHVQVARVGALRTPAMDLDLDEPGELPAEVLDVNTCPAIDLGRILPRYQANPHCTLRTEDQISSHQDTP